jgi:hypothetical protein
MRKAYGGHGRNEPVQAHGYAQVSTNPFGFESKTELWNEIKGILDTMSTTQEGIEQANEDRINASEEILSSKLEESISAYQVVLEQKHADLESAITEIN